MTNYNGNFSALRFLVVDDRPFLRSLIQVMLMRCMARDIKHASDGVSAITTLTTACGHMDCVICDWNMGPVDGLELLRAIRCGDVPRMPRDLHFIMLTGYADEHIVKAAMSLDVDAYLVKPISFDKLVHVVNAVLIRSIMLKSTETYRSKSIVDLPDAVHETTPDKHVPPWVVLSKVRQKNKVSAARSLEQIRHEGNGQSKRLVINQECLDLDNIHPGKVLAEDIYTEHGTLLLAAGTLLNDTLMCRLRELAMVSTEAIRLTVGDYEN
jgi:DNA-binding NarL/FixJ family response regulator